MNEIEVAGTIQSVKIDAKKLIVRFTIDISLTQENLENAQRLGQMSRRDEIVQVTIVPYQQSLDI